MGRTMPSVTGTPKHERFAAANEELRGFLERVDGVANGIASVTDGDLRAVSQRIANLSPEVGDASRGETLDSQLQMEIDEYVRNLRSLQNALEKVRCIVMARKAQLESSKRHLDGLQSGMNAYNQTT